MLFSVPMTAASPESGVSKRSEPWSGKASASGSETCAGPGRARRGFFGKGARRLGKVEIEMAELRGGGEVAGGVQARPARRPRREIAAAPQRSWRRWLR